MKTIYWGASPLRPASEDVRGGFVQRDGETFYRIQNYHRMPPFFMALVSASDHWMFVSSTGGLTCGRKSPDHALFPYETDDKIHDASSTTGPRTLLHAEKDGKTWLWMPFDQGVSPYVLERNLYKNQLGNKLIFEEINRDLGLVFSYQWTTGDRFGFIRSARIENTDGGPCGIELADGLRNLLPFGVTRRMQTELSTLLDAYKQAERLPGVTGGLFTLSSILTDRAEPCEALRATVVWSTGLDGAGVLLSEDQLAAFCAGAPVASESRKRGKRGSMFVRTSFGLQPGEGKSWHLAADINQGHSELAELLREVGPGVPAEEIQAAVESDIESGSRRLLQLVGGADGCQRSSDAFVTARHYSNTLFNIMRGGTFYDGYRFPREDFLSFVETWNRPLHERVTSLLPAADESPSLSSVLRSAEESGDADLERLAWEYLPLTFSRRHGDPSRPWNQFSIDIRDPDGSDKLNFQGNWRDIFQNWEALSLSYPEYIESFIAKFVNASTADGYNPYRITRSGFEWEILEPEDSWSNIGYWGDHQVNYLLRLVELSCRYHPGKIAGLLSRELFVYANVPYRIKAYSELVSDPRDTVLYDDEAAAGIARRVETLGSDGKLLTLTDGSIYRVNLFEKLLVPALTKLGNFVPGGGIWMNTQRPEWNDANNALVGYGLSMVTLFYLRRYLAVLAEILAGDAPAGYTVSVELKDYLAAIERVLDENRAMLAAASTPAQRKAIMDGLGAAAEEYRGHVYAGLSGEKTALEKSQVLRFIDSALDYLDHTIAASKRPDGLYQSYNLIHFARSGYEVEHLFEMLEGQVAALSSGCLDAEESVGLLGSLRDSRIYRSDKNSYMLYPDREQVGFLEKNIIDPLVADKNDSIKNEMSRGRREFILRDVDGRLHFNPRFRNARDLAAALAVDPDVSDEDAAALCDVYEGVFRHRQFTGRSGSMFKYEGLGSIYWHMVSKLLLATAETAGEAAQGGVDEGTLDQLRERFDDVKEGLGMHASPAQYGAFPTDPYSHTPGFSGAQQPGMTGQVKEDVITRFTELGVAVSDGRIAFAPFLLKQEEFTAGPASWIDAAGREVKEDALDAGSLGFTVCGVPVIYRLADRARIQVLGAEGAMEDIEGNQLGEEWSSALFRRDGRIRRIVVDVPRDRLR